MGTRGSGPDTDAWRHRAEWNFFATFGRALPGLAGAWWLLVILRSVLPALVAVATGWLIGRIQHDGSLTGPLILFAVSFTGTQVLPPLHTAVGANLGSRLSNVLNERLIAATLAPDGIGHLERGDLTNDLVTARDFDLGMTGPPMHMNMDFIATGLVTLLGGLGSAAVLFGLTWWAPLVLIAGWSSTHWLLRESGVWRDRMTPEVQSARRHSDYAYRLAVEPEAAKEIRLFGLAPWLIDRLRSNRRRLHDLQYAATRLRERSLTGSIILVVAANLVVFVFMARRAHDGAISLSAVVAYAGAAFGASAIAFGGLSWALDGAAAPVAALRKLEREMPTVGALVTTGSTSPPSTAPEIVFDDVSFTYPTGFQPVLDHFSLTIPAGRSMAIVGQNGAGKTTLAKLLCRLYDPQEGRITVDGIDLRDLDLDAWRAQVTAVFQDFVRYELSLRDNVTPDLVDPTGTAPNRSAARDERASRALARAGADGLASLDTPMAKGYPGGTDVSGGQWQRIALARAVAAVDAGADVVLLDEPTAMLDVRGETEIFRRLLDSTAGCTTVLVSHRFSTVRLADRICVVEHGAVVEEGTHDELTARRGRYHHMYELQASRFADGAAADGRSEVDEDGRQVAYETL